jgi:hypothetical protein
MHRTTRILAFAVAALGLAACSHNKQTPLSQVPADTPYLVANLKPLTDDARKALLPASSSSTLRAAQQRSWGQAADALAAHNNDDLAHLVRAFAGTLKGKSYTQAATEAGIDADGLFAIYGMGLSPVLRGQLKDADKFHAYVDRLEKAYGHPFKKSTLDKITYRHVALRQSKLELIIAVHDEQFVAALLPTGAKKPDLRLLLGLDHPKHSAKAKGKLDALADSNGYGPYSIGYLDTTRLPALIAGGKDPMLKPLMAIFGHGHADKGFDPAKELPASCQSDLARIAARVPLVSFGYTNLKAKEKTQQLDVKLAPDIVKAFKDVGAAVPGLGQAPASDALGDIALALLIPKIRDFWLAHAEAIENKPFTCPALKSVNKLAVQAGAYLPKLSLPPIGELRGLRVVVDQLKGNASGQSRHVRGRVLIASHNPTGLLNTAKAMIPGLSQLKVADDGKAVALPRQSTGSVKLDEPAWIAMNDKALAIGVGKGEQAPLGDMLAASSGQGGTLMRSDVSGKLYVKWFALMADAQTHFLDADGNNDKAVKRMQANMDAMRKALEQVKNVSSHASLTDHGLRVTMDTRMK